MSGAHGNPPSFIGERGAGVGLREELDGVGPPSQDVGGEVDVEYVSKLDDGQLLSALLANEVLAPLSRAVRGERQRKFMAAVATTINMFQVRVADILYSFGQRVSTQSVLRRHRATLEAASLIEVLVSRVNVLAAWDYSVQQQHWLRERLDIVAGSGKQVVWNSGAAVELAELRLGRLDPPPFLLGVLFTVINPGFRVLAAARMLGAVHKGRWSDDDRTYVPSFQRDLLGGADVGPLWSMLVRGGGDMGDVCLVGQGARVLRISFVMPWPRAVRIGGSHFLPEACRLERTGPDACRRTNTPAPLVRTPATDVAHLTYAHEAWARRMGNLPAELVAILEGRYCISKNMQNMRPIFRKNLASWTDNPEAQEALWPEVAKMLWRGTFEYMSRGMRMPLAIMAVSAVPKATAPFWRLVTDARPVNVFADKWNVKYMSIKTLRLILGPKSLFWSIDLKSAYHLTVLGGCGRPWKIIFRWLLSVDERSYKLIRSKVYGCDGYDCSSCCDKAMLAVCMEGHIMRFGATPFGHATSHGPLAILTEAFVRYISRVLGLDGGSYVDDILMALQMLWHGDCVGLERGCLTCRAALPSAQAAETQTHALLDELHLTRSEKGCTVGQRGEFIGVICDTHLGLFLLTERKLGKIMHDLAVLLASEFYSRREAANARGKLVNYGQCMEGLRPFSVPFTVFIGSPESDYDWDEKVRTPSALRENAEFLYKVVPDLAKAGAPIWRLDPATIMDRWQRGLPLPFRLVVVTYDAAIYGIGVSVRTEPRQLWRTAGKSYGRLSSVVTFDQEYEHQVHREGWACPIALETAIELTPPGPAVVLLRNDCAPALAGLQKGSYQSPMLQGASVDVHKQCIQAGWTPMFLHVSGERLIEEGVDDGSRTEARRLRGPKCSDQLRRFIFTQCAAEGYAITIDLFASTCNALVERFASWTKEPRSEAVDAFSLRSWESSLCPSCGARHKEIGFYFPPPGLEDRVVSRARSDGARGVFLVPTRQRAGYWMALRRASTRWMHVPESCCVFEYTERVLGAHTLFLVDFEGPSDSVEACAAAGLRRDQGRSRDPLEEAEKEELRLAMRGFELHEEARTRSRA